MQPGAQRQRFIPYRKTDIVRMCCDDDFLSESEVAQFKDICQLLTHLYHIRFHRSLETLKDSYAPVNPDADTQLVYESSQQQIQQ